MLSRTVLPVQAVFHRKWIPWVIGIGVVSCVSILYADVSIGSSTSVRHQLSSLVINSISPSVQCPSPHDVDTTRLDRTNQRCSPLSSTHPEFSLQICHDPSVCNTFTVKIARTDQDACSRAEGTPNPSTDAELNRWIRTTRGPDTFLIKTDGAQRYASTWSTYQGDCSYAFDVRLKNAGPVYLRVWHTFENYEAFSETNQSWPEQLWTPLTASPIQMNICSPSCVPITSDLIVPDMGLTFYPPESHTFTRQDFPDCTGDKPIRGSYLPLNPLDILYPSFGVPSGNQMRPTVNRYRFVPETCNFRHAGLRFGDPRPCVSSKKKILFWGDSHGRVVCDAVVHRLRGGKEFLTKSDKAGNKIHKVGAAEAECQWDAQGGLWAERTNYDELCNRLGMADAFAMSVGAHYAVAGTTAEYISSMTAAFTAINACPKQPKRKVFLTNPAQPPRQDTYVRKFRDHRTNVRLEYWADLSAKVALEFGWAVVDQFDLTLSHHEEVMNIDKAHYLATDAIDPIVDEVIEKMGICPRLPDAPDASADDFRP